MARRKSIIIMPRLNDSGGDLSKKWFVEYSCRDPRTEKMQRFRIYEGFGVLQTAKERYEFAEKLISKLSENLINGITPFTEEQKIIYEDDLMYHNAARLWGNKKSSTVTIRTYLNEFLQLKKAELTPKSYQTYTSKLRIFCMFLEKERLDQVHVSQIKQEHIASFVRFIAEKNSLSRLSILKYEQIVCSFFYFLIRNKKIIEQNPVYDLPKVGLRKDHAPHPVPDRERKLLKKEMLKSDPQLWLVCQIEFYAAIRPGEEIRKMRIGDINFEAQTITIRKDVSKNRKTETVGFSNQLLKEFIEVYELHEYPSDYYVFSKDGKPGTTCLGKNNFRNRFNKVRDQLGLSKNFKLYSFKHTGATKLAEKGLSTWELQRHLRHTSVAITENYIRRTIGIRSEKIKNEFPDI